jgi:hypothetical protein
MCHVQFVLFTAKSLARPSRNQRFGTGEINRKGRKERKKIPSGIPDVGAYQDTPRGGGVGPPCNNIYANRKNFSYSNPVAPMKQSVIRESLDTVLLLQATTSSHLSRANGFSTERGFSNPREYADKNVRAPLDFELRALRVLRGENIFTVNSQAASL